MVEILKRSSQVDKRHFDATREKIFALREDKRHCQKKRGKTSEIIMPQVEISVIAKGLNSPQRQHAQNC